MYTAALIIAVLSLPIEMIPFISWLIIHLNIFTVVVGYIGYKRRGKISMRNYRMAVWALVLGLIPLFNKLYILSSIVLEVIFKQ